MPLPMNSHPCTTPAWAWYEAEREEMEPERRDRIGALLHHMDEELWKLDGCNCGQRHTTWADSRGVSNAGHSVGCPANPMGRKQYPPCAVPSCADAGTDPVGDTRFCRLHAVEAAARMIAAR